MLLGLDKYSIHKPINCLGASHKYYPLYLTKNAHHVTTKIGPQNYTISIKIPKALTLWENPKSPTKPSLKPVATRHLYKARCYTAPPKPAMMRHLQKPLRCGTSKSSLLHGIFTKSVAARYIQSPLLHDTFTKPTTMRHLQNPLRYGTSKTRYDTTLLLSPLLHNNIFKKFQKAQILFWHIFIKAQYYFGDYL